MKNKSLKESVKSLPTKRLLTWFKSIRKGHFRKSARAWESYSYRCEEYDPEDPDHTYNILKEELNSREHIEK